MQINSNLLYYGNLNVSLSLNDGDYKPYPKFIWTKGNAAYINYSVFLNFNITKEFKNDEGELEKEVFSLSVSIFDMRKIKKFFEHFIEFFESDFYDEIEHPDKGLIKRIKEDYKEFSVLTFTNVTEKHQLCGRATFLVNKDTKMYVPAIALFIDSNDSKTVIDSERFLALADLIVNLDLHSAARETIALFSSTQNLKKRVTMEVVKDNNKNIQTD